MAVIESKINSSFLYIPSVIFVLPMSATNTKRNTTLKVCFYNYTPEKSNYQAKYSLKSEKYYWNWNKIL